MADLIQGINTPTTGGTDHTLIMVPDVEDSTADCSHAPIHTTTEVATSEGTHHALLPATAAACATPQLMDAPFTFHALRPTGIETPHPTLTISLAGANHATPLTTASFAPADPTMQHKIPSPGR